MRSIRLFSALLVILACPAEAAENTVTVKITLAEKNAAMRFGADEINRAALTTSASNSLSNVSLELDSKLGAQVYRIERSANTIRIIGGDAAGAMYGGLDVAEAIRLGMLSELKDGGHKPHIARRGIKFNIPLDLRTPSYSDCSDAFQANIPEVWDMDFWRSFLDTMARDRFNVLTLWSLHPFPSLVKVPEYPDVALDDVWRTTLKLDDSFSTDGADMVADLASNVSTCPENTRRIVVGPMSCTMI